jgi:hypothetical protein
LLPVGTRSLDSCKATTGPLVAARTRPVVAVVLALPQQMAPIQRQAARAVQELQVASPDQVLRDPVVVAVSAQPQGVRRVLAAAAQDRQERPPQAP